MENKPLYIAFDSNVLSDFADLYNIQNGKFNEQEAKKIIKSINRLRSTKTIYENILNGTVRPVIVTVTYNEISLTTHIMPFVDKYGWFPNVTVKNEQARKKAIENIAIQYCEEFETKEKKTSAAMEKAYSAQSDRVGPSNDAFAMAESTYEGIVFVTNNGRHFIYYGDQPDNQDRARKIIAINIKNGYYADAEDDPSFKLVSKPMTPDDLSYLLTKKRKNISLIQPEDNFYSENHEMT